MRIRWEGNPNDPHMAELHLEQGVPNVIDAGRSIWYCDYYEFESSGRDMTISVNSHDFDPDIYLMFPDGTCISSNHWNPGGSTRIVEFVPLGRHRILVTSHRANSTGQYELYLNTNMEIWIDRFEALREFSRRSH